MCVDLITLSSQLFAGDLTPSQFPVFTIYVQKTCLKSAAKCNAAWSFERVMDHDISATEIGKSTQTDRAACMESCLLEDKCRLVTSFQTSPVLVLAWVVSIALKFLDFVQWSILNPSPAFYLWRHSESKTVQWRMKEINTIVNTNATTQSNTATHY